MQKLNLEIEHFKYFPKMLNAISSYLTSLFFISYDWFIFITYSMDTRLRIQTYSRVWTQFGIFFQYAMNIFVYQKIHGDTFKL